MNFLNSLSLLTSAAGGGGGVSGGRSEVSGGGRASGAVVVGGWIGAVRKVVRGMTVRLGWWGVTMLVGVIVTESVQGADLTLAIEPRWGGQVLAVPSGEVATGSGQTVRVTRLAALVSEVVLVRAGGEVVRLPGQFGFLEAESGRMAVRLSGVPDGDYAGLGFQVGVPAEVNHADPSRWTAGHPLNPLVNGLHWGWQGGYVFLALEGKWRGGGGTAVDGRAKAAGEAGGAGGERGFSYHLATDARLMAVRFTVNFRVEGGTTAALALDVARVMRGVTLAPDDGSESTHSATGDTRAVQLAQAVERAWFWLEARPTATGGDGAVAGKAVGDVGRDGKGEAGDGKSAAKVLMAESGATPRAFQVPAGFPQPALPGDNPLTVEGAELGERLFSDTRLSGNGTQSCASCHAPGWAFSDTVARSLGADGKPGARNAMPLMNLAWSGTYAWDGSKPRIRDQVLAAMTNPIEMHGEPARVVERLKADVKMGEAFAAAFGSREITVERVGLALEQYLLTLVSADSKFDRSLRGEAQLSEEEKEGFALFLTEYDPVHGKRGADCFHCHGGPLFSDFGFKNNGLDWVSADAGRETISGSDREVGKFKTPSLRNVAVTAPYMHDGRFASLEEVIAHYDHGVKRAEALDPNLAKHPDAGLQLTSAEQRTLVAFLRTLTDERFVAAAHSSPSQ